MCSNFPLASQFSQGLVSDLNIIWKTNQLIVDPAMSTMSKLTSASGRFAPNTLLGDPSQSYINTPFYKTEFVCFKARHVRRQCGDRAADITFSPFPAGLFPPTRVSIPHDLSFLIASAFCPRVLSIFAITPPTVSINRILTTPANLDTSDTSGTILMFGDAAVTVVKKGISSKGAVAAGGVSLVKDEVPTTVKKTANRPLGIYFGDAPLVSAPHSRFLNTPLTAERRRFLRDRLAAPYRRVINEVIDINTSNIVSRIKTTEELVMSPVATSSTIQKMLEAQRRTPTIAMDSSKFLPFSRPFVKPKPSTTRQTRSVFYTGFIKAHSSIIRKNVIIAVKVAEAADGEQVTTRQPDHLLRPHVAEDITITQENILETVNELKNAPPVTVLEQKSVQAEVQMIPKQLTHRGPCLIVQQCTSVVEDSDPRTLFCPEAGIAQVPPVEYLSTIVEELVASTEAIATISGQSTVSFLPIANSTLIFALPAVIKDRSIISGPVSTPRDNIGITSLAAGASVIPTTTRPRALATACDYARMFDASVESQNGKPPKPEPKYIALPANEPQRIPAVNDMQSLQTIRHVARQFDLEPPGTESVLGPRNDNDWRDIANIQMMPTIDELLPGRRTVYMPRKEKMFPLSRVVDLAFRHYRESSLGPVRDSTADAMARMVQGVGFPTTTIEVAGTAYNAYPNAQVERCHCTEGRFAAPAFSIAFTSPGHDFIAREKVLRGGHLLALLTLSGAAVEVAWLKAVGGWSDRDGLGRISAIGTCILVALLCFFLNTNILIGRIEAEILDEGKMDQDIQRLLGLQGGSKTSVLLDFGGALLDGFVNALTVLQQMTHEQLPFAEALFQPEVGSSIVELPLYLRGLEVDLSPLGYNLSVRLPSVRSDAGWEKTMRDILSSPNEDRMSFTGGQAVAIIHSLTSSLSAIQGPPGINYSIPLTPYPSVYTNLSSGTGKSFIGCRVAKLLCTARRGRSGGRTIPILMAYVSLPSYMFTPDIFPNINHRAQTNHALDETLAGYIKSGLKVARFGIAQGREKPEPDHVAWQAYILPQEEGRKVRRRIMEAKRGREDAAQELSKLLEEVSNGLLSWFRVAPYLKDHCPAFHRTFSDPITDGRSEAGGLYNFWAANKDASEAAVLSSALQNTIPEGFRRCGSLLREVVSAETSEPAGGDSGRSVEELLTEPDPWALGGAERLRLINSWRQELDKHLVSRVQSAQAALHSYKLEFEEASRAEVVAKILGFGLFIPPDSLVCLISY